MLRLFPTVPLYLINIKVIRVLGCLNFIVQTLPRLTDQGSPTGFNPARCWTCWCLLKYMQIWCSSKRGQLLPPLNALSSKCPKGHWRTLEILLPLLPLRNMVISIMLPWFVWRMVSTVCDFWKKRFTLHSSVCTKLSHDLDRLCNPTTFSVSLNWVIFFLFPHLPGWV